MLTNELEKVMAALTTAGGKPYVVGGAVRDMLLGNDPKDMDVEVYNLTVKQLTDVLRTFGRVDQVGVSFGIVKLKMGGNDYDFSLPRRESKSGTGHKGFVVEADPTMTLEEACARRDYTVNAMAYCPVERKVIDYYGGQADLKSRVLRHTSPAFAEDPLRVLRGFQFAGRLRMTVAPETAVLCRKLREEFPTLASERVWGEWEKWALKSVEPGYGIRFLRETGWDACFDGLNCTEELECIVNKALSALENDASANSQALVLFSAAFSLMPDVETLSKVLVETFNAPAWFRERIIPIYNASETVGEGLDSNAVRRLAVRLEPATIRDLVPVLKGCSVVSPDAPNAANGAWMLGRIATILNCLDGKVKPILMGKHLLDLGSKPGPELGRILKSVYEAQLDGSVTDLNGALALARSLQTA